MAQKFEIDERLEKLSNKVRSGTPIEFSEALEVIAYQEMLKANRVSLKDKIINFFKRK